MTGVNHRNLSSLQPGNGIDIISDTAGFSDVGKRPSGENRVPREEDLCTEFIEAYRA
jgi:hypothetical protein